MKRRATKTIPPTADALAILEGWSKDDPQMQAMVAEERSNAAVARQIYELRTARGLTQKQLAELIGTKQPVIARLEDADYEGHSLAMLYRIAASLGCSVSVTFVPRRSGRKNRTDKGLLPSVRRHESKERRRASGHIG